MSIFSVEELRSLRMYRKGDKVQLRAGGNGGLNFHFLNEEGFYDAPATVMEVYTVGYLVESIKGTQVRVEDRDIEPDEHTPADWVQRLLAS